MVKTERFRRPTKRKQESVSNFVNPFARYMESKVSKDEVLQRGQKNPESLRPNSAQGEEMVKDFSSESKPCSSSSLQGESSGVPITSSVSPDPLLDFFIWKANNMEALDLVSARKLYQVCRTPEQKSGLRELLQPVVISRLEKLSKMEQKISVGDEIADAIDFLESLNPSAESRFIGIGKISQKSRRGVISIQEGMMQLKEAQDTLLSELQSLSSHPNKDHVEGL